jgi:MFS family permease
MAIQIPRDFRRVIIAASVGNVIEWYDFYIFGSLAAVLSVKFFEQSHPVAALLSTIALFTAGFLIRPLGAFLFGWATGSGASIRSLLRSAEWDWARGRSG